MEEVIKEKIQKENSKMDNMLDTNELNRLQRAAKNKDKNEIKKWAEQFEETVNEKYFVYYQAKLKEWIINNLKDIDIALCYTLHNNEKTKFGNERLKDVMTDLAEIIKNIAKGEYTRKEFRDLLMEDGIRLMQEENWGIASANSDKENWE